MGSRFPSHQLSNGLYVSGRPDQQTKEKPPTMSSVAMPYTGGDIKKSGELGKMFDVHAEMSKSRKSGPINAPSRTGSFTTNSHSGQIHAPRRTNSGPLNRQGESMKKSSGPQSVKNSGSVPMIPVTGLITSGPITSGPLNSSGAPKRVSGSLDSNGSMKLNSSISMAQNQALTNLSQHVEISFRKSFPKSILWAVILLFVMGFILGGFILGAVHNPILLIVVAFVFGVVAAIFTWNSCYGRRAVVGFIKKYPDAELRTAKDGQYVKVSGVVTCGNIPLESSFQRVPRCVYTSTCLYEYRGLGSKTANPEHRLFTWGLRSAERYAADFYISDFQSGLRALVKTGYGAKVTPYVDESVVINFNPNNKDMSPQFLKWLSERNLSSDDRIMRLKEGYIKEGSTVSVTGVIQRNDNVLMIVPPSEPLSTGCQWSSCILPVNLDGIVLSCEDTSNMDVIPV